MTMNKDEPPVEDIEQDGRFPSGPWKGFFLQPGMSGRSWMEIRLTFRKGELRGEGRDWGGESLFRGRSEVETGKCLVEQTVYAASTPFITRDTTKGKVFGGCGQEWLPQPHHRGGYHIWPVAMGDPTEQRLAEALEEPNTILDTSTLEVAGVGVDVGAGEE